MWFVQTLSPAVLYNYLLLSSSLELGIAHFANIQLGKPHCATTAMYNRCVKAKENMHPLLCLERTNKPP